MCFGLVCAAVTDYLQLGILDNGKSNAKVLVPSRRLGKGRERENGDTFIICNELSSK
jgi:hypothetical protein